MIPNVEMASIIDRVLPTKPSPEELEAGRKPREELRKKMMDLKAKVDETLPTLTSLNVKGDITNLQSIINKELAWINANIEITKQQVETKQIEFQEKTSAGIDTLKNAVLEAAKPLAQSAQEEIAKKVPLEQVKNSLLQLAKQTATEVKEKTQKANQELLNRTAGDDIYDAFVTAGKILIYLFIGILVLRIGAYSANEVIWRPVPYRIASFLYGVLFSPIFIIYYGIIIIRALLWPDTCEYPLIEGLIPIYPYEDTKEELTFADRLFGYPNSPGLQQFIQQKQQTWLNDQKEIIETNFLEKVLEERKDPK